MKDGHRDGCQCHGCVCSRYELEIYSLTNDIEHERKENAVLKEQVAQLQTIISEEAKDSGNVVLELEQVKETIAEQQAHIEQMWEAFAEFVECLDDGGKTSDADFR